MIIQVAGTNGAGKSTVVRAVLAAGRIVDSDISGYDLALARVKKSIRVVGAYLEGIDSGGCDRFKSTMAVYNQIRAATSRGQHVIWEGVRDQNQTRGPALVHELELPYVVVLLTTPYGVCLDGINERRAKAGNSPLINDRDIRGTFVRANNYAARMRDVGARVIRAGRDEAPGMIIELLQGGT